MTMVEFDSRDEAIKYIMKRQHEMLLFNLVEGKLIKPEYGHGAAYVLFVFEEPNEERAHRVIETVEKRES